MRGAQSVINQVNKIRGVYIYTTVLPLFLDSFPASLRHPFSALTTIPVLTWRGGAGPGGAGRGGYSGFGPTFRARSPPLYSFSALCNIFTQSQKSTSYQRNNHLNYYFLFIYFYIQETFSISCSLFFCLSLNILIVHLFVLCRFLFSLFLFMYQAPYAEALQFRCTLCTMTIKHSNSNSNSFLSVIAD